MQGKDEGQGPDQMGGQSKQAPALAVGLEDQSEAPVLEVAEPSVDEAAGTGAGSGRQVPLLDEHGPEAAHGGIACDPCAGDPAANDQEIRRLRGQRIEPGAP
jgi:hypothetical protein